MSEAPVPSAAPASEPGDVAPTWAEPGGPATLVRIVEAALDQMHARYGALVLVDAQGRVEAYYDAGPAGPRTDSDLVGTPLDRLGALAPLVTAGEPSHLRGLDGLDVPDVPELRAARHLIASPVRIRGRVAGAVLLVDRLDGEPFDDENGRMLAPIAAAVSASAENDLLYEEMRRRQRWLEATNEVTTRVLSGAPRAEVLQLIAERVTECTPADGVAILLVDEDGRMIVELATGEASEIFSGMVGDESWASSAAAIESGHPVVIDDLGSSRRSEHPAFRRLGPCMLIPMLAADTTLGAIAVANYRGGRPFDPVDLAMAEAFAGQSALAAVLAEARSERERLLVFEERDRIARDLHDLVIQRLFATGMLLQGVSRSTPLPEGAEERVSRAVDELDGTVREIRQTIFALNHEPSGVASSLRGRILHEVASAVPALGFQPHLHVEGAVDTLVPDEVANDLVAATREALANVVRHAHASAVDVNMRISGDAVVLEIVDDGVGVQEGGRRSGLLNLAKRASGAGGWAATWPSKPDGTGTRLTFQARIR